jgi:hypothetical protein
MIADQQQVASLLVQLQRLHVLGGTTSGSMGARKD